MVSRLTTTHNLLVAWYGRDMAIMLESSLEARQQTNWPTLLHTINRHLSSPTNAFSNKPSVMVAHSGHTESARYSQYVAMCGFSILQGYYYHVMQCLRDTEVLVSSMAMARLVSTEGVMLMKPLPASNAVPYRFMEEMQRHTSVERSEYTPQRKSSSRTTTEPAAPSLIFTLIGAGTADEEDEDSSISYGNDNEVGPKLPSPEPDPPILSALKAELASLTQQEEKPKRKLRPPLTGRYRPPFHGRNATPLSSAKPKAFAPQSVQPKSRHSRKSWRQQRGNRAPKKKRFHGKQAKAGAADAVADPAAPRPTSPPTIRFSVIDDDDDGMIFRMEMDVQTPSP